MGNKSTGLAWFMLIALGIIWGSSFILMKRGMYTADGEAVFSDIQVGSLRMAIASGIMLPFGLLHLRKIKQVKEVLFLLIVGFCGNFFPAYLFTFAETEMNSGLAGILNSFTSFFTILIGYFLFKQQIVARQVLGLILAFGGICLLVGHSVFSDKHQVPVLHIGAIVLATMLYGTSLNTIKHRLQHFSSLQIASISFSFLAIPAWIMLFISGVPHTLRVSPHAFDSLGYILVLSIFGTCLALLIFNRIIALKSAVFASSVTYIIPVIALVIGSFYNSETISLIQVFGMGVIVSGVYIANSILKLNKGK